jgi:hypothetical protein
VGSLSVILDDALDLRTIELRVLYDPEILESIDGSPGQLFLDLGCPLFTDFEDEAPGEWFGACVALGSTCWVTGPGELYQWEFHGLADGASLVTAVQVRLFNPQAILIPDVSLPATSVMVGDATAIPEPFPEDVRMSIYPNPFNPSTQVLVSGKSGGSGLLEVYDLTGLRCATLWQGQMTTEPVISSWDGCDDSGRSMPSGIYLFRLSESGETSLVRRGMLLR